MQQSHPQKSIKWPILHKLCDDSFRWGASYHPLQLQYVGMVKLAQDACLAEEHVLFTVCHPPT